MYSNIIAYISDKSLFSPVPSLRVREEIRILMEPSSGMSPLSHIHQILHQIGILYLMLSLDNAWVWRILNYDIAIYLLHNIIIIQAFVFFDTQTSATCFVLS